MKEKKEIETKVSGPAPLWKRVVAYFIDTAIISVVVIFPLQNKITLSDDSWKAVRIVAERNPEMMMQVAVAMSVIGIITIMYWAVLEYKIQQSVGKIIMNLKVTGTGSKITLWQSIVRNLSKISGAILFLDVLYMLIKHQDQRYLEHVTKTKVVEG